jgi:hypothetical protein
MKARNLARSWLSLAAMVIALGLVFALAPRTRQRDTACCCGYLLVSC